ncbi:MAG: hypothetical protein OXU29_03165 [Gammaproteobacteria bacterium]|nr:hypothetical protein [Gammaproteobacteria bacterium]
MKLRDREPWMPADEYGRSLRGLSVNLLVRDVAGAVKFQRTVLGAEVVYSDPDFAVLRACGGEWMLHADHTYLGHPMHGIAANAEGRGAGLEIRLHGRDPDAATAAARKAGYTVLAAAADKPHGLREAHIIDEDGYVWVADVASK